MDCELCRERKWKHHCRSCYSQVITKFQEDLLEACQVDRKAHSSTTASRTVASRQEKRAPSLAKQLTALLESRAREQRFEELIFDFDSELQKQRAGGEARQAELRKLKHLVAKKKQTLNDRRAVLASAKKRLERVRNLMLTSIGVEQPLLGGLTTQLERLNDLIAKDRRKRVMQLLQLFPISTPVRLGPDGVGSIGNMTFPTSVPSLEKMTQDARVAAISIIVRILMISSSYLSLPLLFEMSTTGSKAMIKYGDEEIDITEPGESIRRGMELLNLNVEYLSYAQGVPIDSVHSGELLHNLWQVFHSPSLGRSIYRSLEEANSRTSLVNHPKRRGNSADDISDRYYLTRTSGKNEWDLIETPKPPETYNIDELKHWTNAFGENM